jgi:hypothetical protein
MNLQFTSNEAPSPHFPKQHVSCRLMGGLGNQLFQIFTTIAYGIEYQRNIVFPYSETLDVGIQRPTYWSSFLSSISSYTTLNPKYALSNRDLMMYPLFNITKFRYQRLPKIPYDRVMFQGYFQSYLYFEQYKEVLFNMINLDLQLSNIYSAYSSYFIENLVPTSRCVISMHFRLGDYKEKQDCHPVLPYAYYHSALSAILSKDNRAIKTYRVLYFCEEEDNEHVTDIIARLKQELTDCNIDFVKVDDTIADWEQMLLMACCDCNIIANSTFSWWGAYFNRSTTAIICYPSIWFGPSMPECVDDLFPGSWIKIDI